MRARTCREAWLTTWPDLLRQLHAARLENFPAQDHTAPPTSSRLQ